MPVMFGGSHNRTIVFCVAALCALAGCGGGGGGGGASVSSPSDNNNPSPPANSAVTLTYSPMDLAGVDYIVPMGNINPPGHTFPTDHIYFYFKDRSQTYTVYAPASGTISWVHCRVSAVDGADYKINIDLNSSLVAYIDHVVLSEELVTQMGITGAGSKSVSIPITAGQVLGTTGGRPDSLWAMDLGIVNYNVTQPFLNQVNYADQTLHADSPLKFYTGDLQSQMYSLVRRTGSDKDGKIAFDVTGRLVGNWFLQGAVAEQYTKQLAFVYDVFEPSQVRVSIGGSLSFSGLYAVQAGAIDPAYVTQASGKVVYKLYNFNYDLGVTNLRGSMMVQMIGPSTIKVQTFDGVSNPTDFTSSALTYTR